MSKQSIANLPISLDQKKINQFCQRHEICQLSLFGSVLREDFTEDSDVDFLVVFEPNNIPGYIRLSAIEMELSELIKRKADLRTIAELSRYFRQQVQQEALTIYVKD